MEKFRAFLEVLKKYHFWVLGGLILLLSFGSWFLAASAEEKNYDTRKRLLDSDRNLVQGIANNQEHPSTKSIQHIRDVESGPLTSQVAGASTRLYDEQRDANPLPQVFPNEKDQKEFKAAFYKIWGPMEEIEKLPPGALDEYYRSQYRYHIDKYFPKLFDLIERRTEVENSDDPAAGRRGGKPGRMGAAAAADQAEKMVGIVDWVDADKKIKTFLDRFAGGTPTTLDIMMTQEDLWIYATLLKVIRYTNDRGTDPKHLEKNYRKPENRKVAPIKQILEMDIGKDAVQSWGKCESALFNLPNEAAPAPAQPSQPPPRSGAAAAPGSSPLVDRYVDDKGKPLADPTQQPYGEFRMMPINLKVVIEQREIPRLLAECANSAMRIDVRRVRILEEEPPVVNLTAPEAAQAGSEPSATAPTMSMPMHKGMHHFGGMGRGNIQDDSGAGKGGSAYEEESADPVYPPVPVEVQGIIYIYNPPKVQTSGETAGDNGGQTPQVTPTSPKPADTSPATGPAAITPAASGAPTIPSTKPSATGVRP